MKDWLISWKEAAPAAGVLVAFCSAIVALWVLHYTRAANRRRATLDMVMNTLMDASAQQQNNKFKAVLRKDQDPANPFKLTSLLGNAARGTPDRVDMLNQLNVYELMALGIRRKVFDEAFYKRWFHNQFMEDYEASLEFIRGFQQKKSTIFCECSWLYQKWLKDGHPDSMPNRFVWAWWGLTKQHAKIDAARQEAKAR